MAKAHVGIKTRSTSTEDGLTVHSWDPAAGLNIEKIIVTKLVTKLMNLSQTV